MQSTEARTGLPRFVRATVLVALLVALLAPVALDRDGYPLSIYPMYSSARGPTTTFVTANGIDADGDRVRLSLDVIGRSDDPLVVAGELRAAVRNDSVDRRCEEIAERAAASSERPVVAVEVVTERHDTVEATNERPSLLDRTVLTQCRVPGA